MVTHGRDAATKWFMSDVTSIGCGINSTYSRASDAAKRLRLRVTASDSARLIAAVGGIARSPFSSFFNGRLGTEAVCRQKYTWDLLVGADLAAVLPLGDLQYESGGAESFDLSYDPRWGRLNSLVRSVPGNHEYQTSGSTDCDTTGRATPYFDYFGPAAGERDKGYYSYRIGHGTSSLSTRTMDARRSRTDAPSLELRVGVRPRGRWHLYRYGIGRVQLILRSLRGTTRAEP